MKISAFLSVLVCGFVLIGCSQPAAEPSSTDTPKPETTAGATGAAGTTGDTPVAGTTGDPAANAEMAKCAECGTEVAMADLKDHEGKMVCAKCIAAHGH